MRRILTSLVVVGVASFGLAACSTSGGGENAASVSAASSTTTKSNGRERLSRAEVMAAYSGKTARGSGHSTTYNADGTWVSNKGVTGSWSVAGDGTLVMTGGMNMRLQIFTEGNRYYHRNARSGSSGYYSVG